MERDSRWSSGGTKESDQSGNSQSWIPSVRVETATTTDFLRRSGPWANDEPLSEPPGPCDSSDSFSDSIIHVPPSSTTLFDEDQLPPRIKSPHNNSVESESSQFDLWDKIIRHPSQETFKTSDAFPISGAISSVSSETQEYSPSRREWHLYVFKRVATEPRYTSLMLELLKGIETELGTALHPTMKKSISGASTQLKSRSRKISKKPFKKAISRKRRKSREDLKDLENRCIELMVKGDEKEESTTATEISIDLRPFLKKKCSRKKEYAAPGPMDCDAYMKAMCCLPLQESAISFPDSDPTVKPESQQKLVVKPTLASTLREAATFAKDASKEEEMLVHLLSKSTSVGEYETFLMEMRDRMEQERVVDVHRKHMEGLISYEEAIKAKLRVMAENVAKGQMYLEEKRHLIGKLHKIHDEIEKKNKAKISDVKAQYKQRENNVFKAFMEKQFLGAAGLHEKHELMKTKSEKETNELKRKIMLIKEFKILQTIRKEQIKEAKDEKLKYLRRMSADEIQARLIIFKRKFKEELLVKQRVVDESRTRTAALKMAVIEMVAEHRKRKMMEKDKKEAELALKQTSILKTKGGKHLIALHEKLMDLRKARLASKIN